MNRCILPEEFQRLLAEQLSDGERQALDAHVDACARCQESLALLLDDAVCDTEELFWRRLRRDAPASTSDSPEAFLRRLKDMPPPATPTSPNSRDVGAPLDILFPEPATLEGSLGRLESYHILAELGRGAFGLVFKAYDEKLDCPVALKVLRPELAASVGERARFEDEARKAAAVRHDHVVAILRVGSTPGFALPYFVMEYIAGESLSDRLGRQGVLEPKEAAEIVRQVALGLAAAHARGQVHRDIKPSNILLEKSSGRAKITDFGLARTLEVRDRKLTRSGAIMGTPPYMSPEQITAPHQLDPRSDIYSLGVVLYELLTGEPPFRGLAQLILQQVVHEEARRPRRLNDAIPRDLETICQRCLQKDPGKRYASSEGLAEDLRRFLAGEPIIARPVGSLERSVKWARRRPAIAGLLALIFFVAVLGFGLVTWQWLRAATAVEALEDKTKLLAAMNQDLVLKNYVRNIALAALELATDNIGRAEELLDECPEDVRAWEWHYLQRLRYVPPLKLSLGGRITMAGIGADLAFSPNGKFLATAGVMDVKVWDPASGREVFTLPGHTDRVVRVCFSPDSRRLASAGKDGKVILWDATTGREMFRLHGHTGPVTGLTFSPDGRLLASTGLDHQVKLWDITAGKERFCFQGQFLRDRAVEVAFSPDGNYLACPGVDHTVKLWDVMTGRDFRSLAGHTAPVFSVVFSPDGRRLASTGWDFVVRIWDLAESREVFTLAAGYGIATWSTAFSPDGRRVAVGSGLAEGTVRIYDLTTGKLELTLQGHIQRLTSLAFSPDSKRLASSGLDKTVRLWELETGQEVLTLRGHTDLVGKVVFDPQGRRLASSSEDGTVRVWDANPYDESSNPHIRMLRGHAGVVYGVAFSSNGLYLASAGADHAIIVWEAATGARLFDLTGHTETVFAVAFGPKTANGMGRIASASADKTVKIWDGATRKEVRTLRGFKGAVLSLAFSPDGCRLLTCDNSSVVRLWDATTGDEIRTLRGPVAHVHRVAYSPDGIYVAASCGNSMVHLWNANTGQEVKPFAGHSGRVHSVAFSPRELGPKELLLASGDSDCKVKIWEASTGRVLHSLPGHTDYVFSVAFSPDGKRLASASWKEVKVWDVATGKEVLSLGRIAGLIWSVAFSPDGRRLAACGGYRGRGEIKLWDTSAWDKSVIRSP